MQTNKTVKGEQNRERIVDAAERLFYERGYSATSFSHIADESGVPRGNFYFYFRDKRSIFEAVVERKTAALGALCASFEAEHDDPRERLCAFVDHLVAHRDEVARFGCPVGTLAGEVGKWRDEHLAIARRLFDVLRPFLRSQFRALGADSKRADTLAVELLARTQGINTLAQAYGDPMLVRRQGERVKAWLRTQAPR
jgi:TetR/AcrR family transcriptional regulator, transcriptional repressor for nem operon